MKYTICALILLTLSGCVHTNIVTENKQQNIPPPQESTAPTIPSSQKILLPVAPQQPSQESQKTTDLPAALPKTRLYANSSPLNQKIPSQVNLEPNFEQFAKKIAEAAEDAGGLLLQVSQYSTPVFFADATTPRYDVPLSCAKDWELGITKIKNVPIPPFSRPSNDIDGADSPVIPSVCGENSAQDNNMVIIDLVNNCQYDFWQAGRKNNSWHASWANAISTKGNGIYAKGLSTRGSGFSMIAGVIWPHELRDGRIDHALLVVLPDELVRGGGPVPPATDSDGESEEPFALPEGARLRLNPSLNLDGLGLTGAEKTIAKAMQEYGLFVTDRGTTGVALYAIDPISVQNDPYSGLLSKETYPIFKKIPLDQLQVLALPPQDADYREKLSPFSSSCAQFE